MRIDLFQECSNLVNQIPRGRVSTYGTVAKALGDQIARRAVGVMLNQYKPPIKMPCHRIVYAGGGLGGFGRGLPKKIEMLADEGVKVEDGRLPAFEDVFFDEFESTYPLRKARKEQLGLAKKVKAKDSKALPTLILGMDVAYDRTIAFGAGVLYDPDETRVHKVVSTRMDIQFPYVPTYLGFREIPVYEKLITQVAEPAILMVDGNGTLHPFGLGIASHLGVELDTPSIGVAKSKLCGEAGEPRSRGDAEPVLLNGKTIGHALKTSARAKPVYVSPGHLVGFETALALVRKVSTFKSPEPLRLAHQEATRLRREGI